MGKFKDWIDKMSIKDKIKNILLIVFGATISIGIFILSIISRRNRNTTSTNSGSFDRNYSDTKSTLDKIGQGLDSASGRVEHLRHELKSGSKSISDVINNTSNRKE